MIIIKVKYRASGDLRNIRKALFDYNTVKAETILSKVGTFTLDELIANSPVRTGEFRAGWRKEIQNEPKGVSLSIYNFSHPDVPDLAWYLEFGHMSKGHYVRGHHFIVPALEKTEKKLDEVLEEFGYGK